MNAIETEFFKHVTVKDQTACLKDMEAAYTDGMKLYNDATSGAGKLTLLGDAEKLFADLNPLVTDCKPQNIHVPSYNKQPRMLLSD